MTSEWLEMPEYDNVKQEEPFIEAKFKFKNQEDYDKFHKLIKEHLYNGEKVFDGMQRKDKKNAWFPLKEKARKYKYVGNSNPQFPIYIVSKGRAHRNPTSKILLDMGVPFKMIIEYEEFDDYAKIVPKENLLLLPTRYKKEYDQFWKFEDDKTGSGAARNFAWDNAIQQGYSYHWCLDDNIESFEIYNKNLKIKCYSGSFFKVIENFALRYKNLAICGPNYAIFCPQSDARPPYKLNTRVYSCLLIKNNIPFRWRGRYNEDTDLCIRVLKAGYCTVLFNAFLQGKRATGTIKGGNTDEIYNNGYDDKSKMIVDMHPDICKLANKFRKVHHHCNYDNFKTQLIRKEEFNYKDEINNYDLRLEKNYD